MHLPQSFFGESGVIILLFPICALWTIRLSILKGSMKACHLHKQPGDEHRCPGVPTARRLRGHGQLTTYAHSTHKVSKSQVTARIPSSEKQLSHPALHMKPNAQWKDFFHPTPPLPPPRNSTLQPSVVKWCCPHQCRSMCKKTKKQKPHMIALTTSVSISQRWRHLLADGCLLYCWLSFTGDQLELDLV